jgi:hypothetical protein
VFECVEAALDAVALFVEFAVEGSGLFPVPARRDDGDCAEALDLIGDDGFGLPAFQQQDRLLVLGGLAGSDTEGHGQAVFVR